MLTIFTSVTSTPSMNTSIIPHGRTNWIARSTWLKPAGTKPARNGTSKYSMATSSVSGNRMVAQKTMVAITSMFSPHNATIAPIRVVCDVMPFVSSSTIGKACAIRNVISAASVMAQSLSRFDDTLWIERRAAARAFRGTCGTGRARL